MTAPENATRTTGYSIGDVFGVVADRRTYKGLLYLLLAFPLGVFYHGLLLFGFAFGAILSLVGVGIAILLVAVVGSRLFAGFERWLANRLLEVDLRKPEDVDTASGGMGATIRGYLEAPSTWRGIGLLASKLWVGIVAVMLFALLFTAAGIMTAPLHYPHEVELLTVDGEPIGWTIDSLSEALLAAPFGLLFLIALLHVSNAFAAVFGWMATALLDGETSV